MENIGQKRKVLDTQDADASHASKRQKKVQASFNSLPFELRQPIYDDYLRDWTIDNLTREIAKNQPWTPHESFTGYYQPVLSSLRYPASVLMASFGRSNSGAQRMATMPLLQTEFGDEVEAYFMQYKLMIEMDDVETMTAWAKAKGPNHLSTICRLEVASKAFLELQFQWRTRVQFAAPIFLVQISEDGQRLQLRSKFELLWAQADMCKAVVKAAFKDFKSKGKCRFDGAEVFAVVAGLQKMKQHKHKITSLWRFETPTFQEDRTLNIDKDTLADMVKEKKGRSGYDVLICSVSTSDVATGQSSKELEEEDIDEAETQHGFLLLKEMSRVVRT